MASIARLQRLQDQREQALRADLLAALGHVALDPALEREGHQQDEPAVE